MSRKLSTTSDDDDDNERYDSKFSNNSNNNTKTNNNNVEEILEDESDANEAKISTIRYTTKKVNMDDEKEKSSSSYIPDVQYSRKELIVKKRAVFKWLPVLCSNDIVHGSWWFVWGSLLAMLTAVIPLVDYYAHFFQASDNTLPALEFTETWALLIISGFFFTIGSWCFVRAFEEPERHPLLHGWYHFQSDELLGAWLFLFGTIPAVPYTLVFWFQAPGEMIYFMGVVMSIIFVLCTYLFVLACYPSDKV